MAELKSAAAAEPANEYSELSRSVLSLRTLNNLLRSEWQPPLVFERDDGLFQLGLADDAAGPFPRSLSE